MPKAYQNIKDKILGKHYELSLVFSDKELATEMHLKWKKKDGPASILSFPLSQTSGEIFLYKNPELSRNELLSLFIHGCVHLAGFTHGSKMDKEEKKWKEHFNID